MRVIGVDAIQEEHMEVQIEVERAAEALNQRHCAGPGVLVSQTRLLDEMRGNHAIDDPQHLAHDPVRDKPRRSGRRRIARTAEPSYNGVAADNQGSLRQGMPEVTLAERT